jgi:hypothetical protein
MFIFPFFRLSIILKSLLTLVQELIKLPKTFTGIHLTLRQLTPDTTDYRPLLKEIKRSGKVSKKTNSCWKTAFHRTQHKILKKLLSGPSPYG